MPSGPGEATPPAGDPRLRIALDALLRERPDEAAPMLTAYLAEAPESDRERRPALLLAAVTHRALGEHTAFHSAADGLTSGADRPAAFARCLLVLDHLDRGELALATAALGDPATQELTAREIAGSGLEPLYRLAAALIAAARGEPGAAAEALGRDAGDDNDDPVARATLDLRAALTRDPGLSALESVLADSLRAAEASLGPDPDLAAERFARTAAAAHELAANLDANARRAPLAARAPADLAPALRPVADRNADAAILAVTSEAMSLRILAGATAELGIVGRIALPDLPGATPADLLRAPAPLHAAEAESIAGEIETLAVTLGRWSLAQRGAAEREARRAALAAHRDRLEATRSGEAMALADAERDLAAVHARAGAARIALETAIAAATERAIAHLDSVAERERDLAAVAEGLLVLHPAPETGARPEAPYLAIHRATAARDAHHLALLDSTLARGRAAIPALVATRVRGQRWPAVERQLAALDSLAGAVFALSGSLAADSTLMAAARRAENDMLAPDSAPALGGLETAAAGAAHTLRAAVSTADSAAAARARARLHVMAEAGRFGFAEARFQIARREGPVPPSTVTADGPPSLAELRLREAASAFEAFVAADPQGPGASTAWVRVGELRQELSEIDFRRAMARYDADRERGLAGGPPPVRDTQGPAAAARTLLERFPHHPRSDRALYNLAVLARDSGELLESNAHFTRLRRDYPGSPLATEAALRIGDNHFALADHAAAETAYELIAAEPGPLGAAALYKLGWARMNQNDPAGAAEAFGDLLGRDVDLEIKNDAGRTLARCLADQGGAPAAERFFASRPAVPFAASTFHLLSQELASRSDYTGAVDAARMGADRHSGAPEFADLLLDEIAALDQAGRPAEAARVRMAFVRRAGPGTPWFAANGSDSLAAAAATVTLSGADQLMGIAQRQEPGSDFATSHAAYREFLARFPTAADADRAELMAAECEMNLGRPREAANSYARVAAATADTGRARIAAYGAVVAWERARGPVAAGGAGATAASPSASGSPPAAAAAAELDGELGAIDGFTRRFGADPRVPQVLMRRGAIAHQAGRCDESMASYAMLLSLHPQSEERIRARRAQGDVALRCNRPGEAAEVYSTLLAEAARGRLSPGDSALCAEARTLLPVASFQSAAAMDSAGQRAVAATAYAEVARRFPDFAQADLALLRAGDAAHAAGDRPAAAGHYATLASRYPDSPNRSPALLRQAGLAAEAGDSAGAAREYLRYAADYPQSAETEAALTESRRLARAARDWSLIEQSARAELGWRGDRGTAAPGNRAALPARLDLVEALVAGGRRSEARTELDRTLGSGATSASKSEPASPPLAEDVATAHAHLLRAELALPDYERAAITPPLAPAIERKKKALAALLVDLDPAARHGDPLDALKARDYLGTALAEFGSALVAAETPADLQGEDLAAYSQAIADQSDNFQRRAEEAWGEAVAQARRDGFEHPLAESVRTKLFQRYDARYAEQSRARMADPTIGEPVLAEHRGRGARDGSGEGRGAAAAD